MSIIKQKLIIPIDINEFEGHGEYLIGSIIRANIDGDDSIIFETLEEISSHLKVTMGDNSLEFQKVENKMVDSVTKNYHTVRSHITPDIGILSISTIEEITEFTKDSIVVEYYYDPELLNEIVAT